MLIRCENTGDPQDQSAVYAIDETALGRADEANLVLRLRAEGVVLLSLVAEVSNRSSGTSCSAGCGSRRATAPCRP